MNDQLIPAGGVRDSWRRFLAYAVSPPIAPTLIIGTLFVGVYAVLANTYSIPPLVSSEAQTSVQVDRYCEQVSTNAAALGNLHSVTALLLSLLAVLGGLAQATRDDGDSAVARIRRPLLFASAPCVMMAVFLFFRASAANELASVANNARSDPTTMLDVCTRAWGAWVLSRNDANGVAKAAMEESVQGHTAAVEDKVFNVTNKTASSMEDTSKATKDNAAAIQQIADAVINKDVDAAASAKVLAIRAEGVASAAAKSAAEAKSEAAKPVATGRRLRTNGQPDAGPH